MKEDRMRSEEFPPALQLHAKPAYTLHAVGFQVQEYEINLLSGLGAPSFSAKMRSIFVPSFWRYAFTLTSTCINKQQKTNKRALEEARLPTWDLLFLRHARSHKLSHNSWILCPFASQQQNGTKLQTLFNTTRICTNCMLNVCQGDHKGVLIVLPC